MSYPGSPPPPPWANITGISRTVMKDNAQETIVNYDGNARPGEIVVDLTQDPPVPYIGNNLGQLTLLTSAGTYGNAQVGQYLAAGAVGNIIPSGNGIYSLGNSTNYWSNVWIAGNTLYLGGVPLGMSGNVLTVDGNSVLINNTDENISTLGNVTAGNIDITGGSLNWANASIVQTSNVDLSITGDGQVTVRSLDGTYQWTFDDAGNLTAPGNIGTLANVSAGYFIGNGAFLTGISGGGGSGNALVNGDNSFVLDADGNVVFQGEGPGDGVNRGLVWDFGANANGVNSTVRQDNSGLSVRAWTEVGEGTFAAPVNIVTNQDANTNTWIFDGEGDLTLPGNMILSAGNIRSNAIAPAFNSAITGINSGNANVIITIAGEPFDGPASGAVTISGVNPPVQANGDWWYQATGFNEFQLFSDSSLTTPVDGTEWPGYVDGGTAVGVGEYSNLTIQGGNISITSNDNTWIFDTTGNLTIPNDIVSNTTIDIDNRLSGNSADIRLYSADDILLQARDRSEGSGTEGGDINIYAGDSAADGDASGGDIQIIAGNGGAANVDFGGSGGFITIRSGDGGPAIGNSGYNAEDGGDITIQAGSAGDNGGNSSAGSNGGDVFIFSGAATGNNISGGNIVISTGSGGPNGAGGAVQIGIPFSDRGPGGVWTFDGTGNLIVPPTGYINGDDGAWVRIQSLEEGVVRSSMTLNPGDGVTRLESWDNQNSQSFTTADWATGEYIDNGGGSGEIVFTDTPNIRSFFDTIFTSGRLFYQVNGGNLLPSIGWGGGGDNITFYTAIPPATSPETVTDFVIYYSNRSVIEMDYDEGELNIQAQDLDINITSNQDIDIQSSETIRLENSSSINGIFIATDTANTFRSWSFDVAGNLTLPGNGTISNPGNTSLDPLNPNVATMVLTPDANYGYQSLVLDPTAPGHIHLRGPSFTGNIDQPAANIFLGGELSSFEVGASYGDIPSVFIHSNDNTWTFGTDGIVTLPGEGVLQSIGDSVTLSSFNTTTGNANSVYLGSSGGLGFSDQEIGGNWLEIFRSGAEPQIRVPVDRGNLNIQTAQGETVNDWVFDDTGNLTIPGSSGGLIKTVANAAIGIVAMDNGTDNPAQLMSWNVNQANPNTIISAHANYAAVTTDVNGTIKSWIFDNSGNLTTPGNIVVATGIVGSGASPAPYLSGFSSVSAINISASGNVTANNISVSSVLTGGNLIARGTTTAALDVADTGFTFNTAYRAADGYANIYIASGVASAQWTFQANGNLTAPGNISSRTTITAPVAFANLTPVAGARAFVNNANLAATGNFGAQISGGGSNTVPVWSDGTNWYIG